VAWLSRGGDTDEPVAVPRPDSRSSIQPQQTREAAMHESQSPFWILADGDDLQRIVAHGSRSEERRSLQLLAVERS
jgi:hypothetical protein